MRFLCTNCNYVYDNDLGDKEEGIQVGTEVDICPVCDEYDSFQGIEEEVNYIEGEDSFEQIELDHFPEVEIIGYRLIVTIGGEVHPMGEDHRIASVSLYDEYGDLIETQYLDIEQEAKVEFDFDNLDEFEIRVKCSEHGVWGKKFVN